MDDETASVGNRGAASDGFYYGWVVVGVCFIGSFVVFGLSYSFGVFFERILEEFGHPRGVTSVAFGVQTLMLYIGAVFVGAFVDRHGARPVLVAGGALLCLGLVWTSQAASLVGLILAYGVVTGLGLCAVYVVAYATVPKWFEANLGLAGGIATAGLGAGMLIVTPAVSALIDSLGWRSAFLTMTAAAGLLVFLMAIFIRDDPVSADVSIPKEEFAKPPTPSAHGGLKDQFAEIKRVATMPSFVLLFTGWTLIYATLYVVFVHIVVHGTDLGLSRTVGASVIALIGLMSALGRVGIGFVSDTIGHTRVFVFCSLVMGLSTAVLPLADTAATLYVFALVYGLAYGGNGALLAPLTAELFGRANINAIFGLISASFAVSGLLAPSLAGAGHDTFGSYNPVFVAAGIVAILGAVAVYVAGQLRPTPAG